MKYLWCALGGMLLFSSTCFVTVALSSNVQRSPFPLSHSFVEPVAKGEQMSDAAAPGDDPMVTVLLPHLSHEMPFYALFGAIFGVSTGWASGRISQTRKSLRAATNRNH